MTRPLSRRTVLSGLTAAALLAPLTACSGGSSPGAQELEFFQFKPEAIQLFDRICDQFNAGHPGVNFRQNFQADNVTALRVRLVKGRMPDAITINGDYNFGSLARSRVFHNFAGSAPMANVTPSIAEILPTLGVGAPGENNGLPFANNGSGMIYNREIFDRHNLRPPTTWDELIAIADDLKGRGVDPFYWGFRDTWTGAPMFSSISANQLGDVAGWYERRRLGQTNFEELAPTLQKMLQIAAYGNANKFDIGYNDANQGFSQGRAAMYVHGTYAIPAIRSYNPDIQLGTFATPADRAEDTRVVSGVDVALTCGTDPKPEVLQFFEYLMQQENMAAYCAEQVAFPTLTGMQATDPALEGLVPYFTSQRLATYSDHNFPQGVNLNNYMQQFLINRNIPAFVNRLNTQWDRVIARLNSTM